MNTNVLNAQIAGAYFGCQLYREGYTGGIIAVTWANVKTSGEDVAYSEIGKGKRYQLILKSLDEISDEDAVEVAKIISPDWKIEDAIMTTSWAEGFVEMIVEKDTLIRASLANKTWNYLRSKGYDCDNLISQGIAIKA